MVNLGPKVVPFWGSYLEFYSVIPKRNYFGALGFTHRPQSSSFSGFIFRVLDGNPKKELLWGLWVEFRVQGAAHRESVRSRV